MDVMEFLRDNLIDHALRTGNKEQFLRLTGNDWQKHVIGLDTAKDWEGTATRPAVAVEDPPPSTGPTCPKCRGHMVLREGRYGSFYGCADYPKCRGTRPNKN